MMPYGAGWGAGLTPSYGTAWNPYWMNPVGLGWGLGGTRRWGGTYTPQFVMTGLPTDSEIVEMVYDSFDADPIIPYNADIEVDSNAGVVTLTGTVDSTQIKHAAGDDAWWLPGVGDVNNDLEVRRRRPRGEHHEEKAPQQQPRRATMESAGRASR